MAVTTGKKSLTVVAIFGALCVVAAAAVYEHTDVMERKSAVSFKVTELEHGNIPVVSISGSSATGYMSVKNISTRTVGSSIDVCVHIFLARSGTSGTFRWAPGLSLRTGWASVAHSGARLQVQSSLAVTSEQKTGFMGKGSAPGRCCKFTCPLCPCGEFVRRQP